MMSSKPSSAPCGISAMSKIVRALALEIEAAELEEPEPAGAEAPA